MKKIHLIYSTIFFLALLLTAPLLQAQGHHRHHGEQMNKEEKMARMQEHLDLTEQQASEMKAIHEKYESKFEALKNSGAEFDREEMRELHQAMKAEVNSILTEEQQAKMKEIHDEGRGENPGPHGMMHREGGKGQFGEPGSKQGRKEVHAYMKKNVIPVLQAQRTKLDAQMSQEDKAKVDALRAELKAMRPEMKERKSEKRDFRKEGERPTEAQRAEWKAIHEKHRAIRDEAATIAARYQSELEALHAEILPQAEKWRTDVEAIHAKYQGEGAEKGACESKCEGGKGKRSGDKAGKGDHHRGHHGHHGPRHGEMGMMHRKMDPAHFILMDPNASSSKQGTAAEALPAAEMNIYPNPSTTQNTLSFEVQTAGKVRIELLDAKGQLIRQLLNDKRDAGNFTLDVDLSNLSSGVYYYRITDATGARSKNFSVAK